MSVLPHEHETVTAVVLLRDDGAALFQLRDDKPGLRHAGRWVIPGGHCEPGETWDQSARRELREETAYECGALHWLRTVEDRHDPRSAAYRLVVFWGSMMEHRRCPAVKGRPWRSLRARTHRAMRFRSTWSVRGMRRSRPLVLRS